MEQNCRWHFAKAGRETYGKDPLASTFNKPYYSIVREALQNSLDAAKDTMQPVRVELSWIEIRKEDFPKLFKLEEHLKQCSQFVSRDETTLPWVNQMLDYIQNHPSMQCLKISDYNTKGMSYKEGDQESSFLTFVDNIGLSAGKSAGSQGSFGFGKGAYFAVSSIATVLISSVDTDGRSIFEGVTRLTTHTDNQGIRLSHMGYYDNSDDDEHTHPILDKNEIPSLFRRDLTGTDFIIAGCREEGDYESQMVKAVINNFWLSILENKLVVKVFERELNADNIYIAARQYFDDSELENGSISEAWSWNPIPYIKCVKNRDKASDKYKTFKVTSEMLGDMRFFVYRNTSLPNRIMYCRTPRMVVFKKTKSRLSGYVGVFICDSEKGNMLLRALENQSHDEWSVDNLKSEKYTESDCKKALDEISEFILTSLDKLRVASIGKRAYFEGLEGLLSAGEDLLDNEEYYDGAGSAQNSAEGEAATEEAQEETGNITTKIRNVSKKRTVVSQGTYVPDSIPENVTTEEGEEQFVLGHHHSGNNEDNNPYPGTGGSPTKHKLEADSNVKMRRAIRVKFVVGTHFDEIGNISHTIVVDSPQDITDAEIELLDGTDNDEFTKSKIYDCLEGEVDGNIISKLHLKKGVNRINVSFEDNVKHVIKLQAYELS